MTRCTALRAEDAGSGPCPIEWLSSRPRDALLRRTRGLMLATLSGLADLSLGTGVWSMAMHIAHRSPSGVGGRGRVVGMILAKLPIRVASAL